MPVAPACRCRSRNVAGAQDGDRRADRRAGAICCSPSLTRTAGERARKLAMAAGVLRGPDLWRAVHPAHRLSDCSRGSRRRGWARPRSPPGFSRFSAAACWRYWSARCGADEPCRLLRPASRAGGVAAALLWRLRSTRSATCHRHSFTRSRRTCCACHFRPASMIRLDCVLARTLVRPDAVAALRPGDPQRHRLRRQRRAAARRRCRRARRPHRRIAAGGQRSAQRRAVDAARPGRGAGLHQRAELGAGIADRRRPRRERHHAGRDAGDLRRRLVDGPAQRPR